MVNSGSYGTTDGNGNGKTRCTQAGDAALGSQSSESDDAACKSGCSKSADGDLPSDESAIEPTPTKTEINSSMPSDASQKNDFPANDGKGTACSSLPLEKISPENSEDKAKLTRKLLCLYCDRSFVSANLRQKHVERVHSVKPTRRVSARRQNQLSTTPCVHCDRLNASEHTLNDLFQHLVQEHPTKYFGCLSCDERFPTSINLADHNKSKHFTDDTSLGTDLPTASQIEQVVEPFLNTDSKLTRSKLRSKVEVPLEIEENSNLAKRKKKSKLKELRNKKISVKTSKIAIKRSKRLQQQAKEHESQKKRREKKLSATAKAETSAKQPEKSKPVCVNPYPEFDSFYRVKKITDHSIDNLKISSLTFDDVFDKAFFNRIKCNIQENLLHHIDGKLFKNEESESRISNFEKISTVTQEVQNSNADNYGCEISLNAITPASSLSLNSQFGEDFESQIEYGSKPSKKRTQLKSDEVHYKYFTRRKYQASILQQKENRDLSKLDMWTQMIVKDRQERVLNKKKTAKEIQEYTSGQEYKSKIKRQELNRILDRRGPFEDLKEEASKKAAFDKLNSSSGNDISQEVFTDVREVLNNLLDRVFEAVKEDDGPLEIFSKEIDQREIPAFLDLRRKISSTHEEIIDKSDRIALICSSQETENFELPTNAVRGKNELVELTGEWARSRMYICAACGGKFSNMKYLLEHKSLYHQNVWVQHYEFVGNQSELYRHLSIPGLGKVGIVEDTIPCKLWKRSDARTCTKCGKQCNALGELHRHVLECGGDWTWMLARKKCKYRPFGAKSRRKRRGFEPKSQNKRKTEPSEKKIYKKPIDGPRQRPSDADTIQRMLANLPAKRSRRSLISLTDVVFKSRKTNKTASKVKCGKAIHKKHQADSNKINSNQQRTSRALRSLSKVLSSRILDLNSSLMVKRKIKVMRSQRLTRNSVQSKSNPTPKEITTEEDTNESDSASIQTLKKRKSLKKETVSSEESEAASTKNKSLAKRMLSNHLNLKNFFPIKKKNVRSLQKAPGLDKESDKVLENEDTDDSNSKSKYLENFEYTKKNKRGGLKGFVRALSLRKRNSKEERLVAATSSKNVVEHSETSKKSVRLKTKQILASKKDDNNDTEKVASSEDVDSEILSKKRKLQRSFRNVINKVKKMKTEKVSNKSAENLQLKTSKKDNQEQPFLEEPPLQTDSTPEEKVVTPAEVKENIQGNEELAPIVANLTDSKENPPIPETIFNLENSEEKSLQAKCELDFDIKQTCADPAADSNHSPEINKDNKTEPIDLEVDSRTTPVAIDTSLKPKCVPLVSPNVKGKIRKPSRGLNDCIAMLTSKLQHKDEKISSSLESLFSTSSTTSTEPRTESRPPLESVKLPKPENIPKIPAFDANKSPVIEETALDLSKKSFSTPNLLLLANENFINDKELSTTWTSVDDIIQQVVQNSSSYVFSKPKKNLFAIRTNVNDTIDFVVNSSLNWFESRQGNTEEKPKHYKRTKRKKHSDDNLITNIIFGKDKLIIAPSSDPKHDLEDPLIAKIKENEYKMSKINAQQSNTSVLSHQESLAPLLKPHELLDNEQQLINKNTVIEENNINSIVPVKVSEEESKINSQQPDKSEALVEYVNQETVDIKTDSKNKSEETNFKSATNDELKSKQSTESETVRSVEAKLTPKKLPNKRGRKPKKTKPKSEKLVIETNIDDYLSFKEVSDNEPNSTALDILPVNVGLCPTNKTLELNTENEPVVLENKTIEQTTKLPIPSDSEDEVPLAIIAKQTDSCTLESEKTSAKLQDESIKDTEYLSDSLNDTKDMVETLTTDSLKENVEETANKNDTILNKISELTTGNIKIPNIIKNIKRKKRKKTFVKIKRRTTNKKNLNIELDTRLNSIELTPKETNSNLSINEQSDVSVPETSNEATIVPEMTNLETVQPPEAETKTPVKLLSSQRTRRKSKSSKKLDKIDNDLFKDFSLVINKKTKRIPPTSIVDDSVCDDILDADINFFVKPLDVAKEPDVNAESPLNDSVEEMDMEIEDIPINTSIIVRDDKQLASLVSYKEETPFIESNDTENPVNTLFESMETRKSPRKKNNSDLIDTVDSSCNAERTRIGSKRGRKFKKKILEQENLKLPETNMEQDVETNLTSNSTLEENLDKIENQLRETIEQESIESCGDISSETQLLLKKKIGTTKQSEIDSTPKTQEFVPFSEDHLKTHTQIVEDQDITVFSKSEQVNENVSQDFFVKPVEEGLSKETSVPKDPATKRRPGRPSKNNKSAEMPFPDVYLELIDNKLATKDTIKDGNLSENLEENIPDITKESKIDELEDKNMSLLNQINEFEVPLKESTPKKRGRRPKSAKRTRKSETNMVNFKLDKNSENNSVISNIEDVVTNENSSSEASSNERRSRRSKSAPTKDESSTELSEVNSSQECSATTQFMDEAEETIDSQKKISRHQQKCALEESSNLLDIVDTNNGIFQTEVRENELNGVVSKCWFEEGHLGGNAPKESADNCVLLAEDLANTNDKDIEYSEKPNLSEENLEVETITNENEISEKPSEFEKPLKFPRKKKGSRKGKKLDVGNFNYNKQDSKTELITDTFGSTVTISDTKFSETVAENVTILDAVVDSTIEKIMEDSGFVDKFLEESMEKKKTGKRSKRDLNSHKSNEFFSDIKLSLSDDYNMENICASSKGNEVILEESAENTVLPPQNVSKEAYSSQNVNTESSTTKSRYRNVKQNKYHIADLEDIHISSDLESFINTTETVGKPVKSGRKNKKMEKTNDIVLDKSVEPSMFNLLIDSTNQENGILSNNKNIDDFMLDISVPVLDQTQSSPKNSDKIKDLLVGEPKQSIAVESISSTELCVTEVESIKMNKKSSKVLNAIEISTIEDSNILENHSSSNILYSDETSTKSRRARNIINYNEENLEKRAMEVNKSPGKEVASHIKKNKRSKKNVENIEDLFCEQNDIVIEPISSGTDVELKSTNQKEIIQMDTEESVTDTKRKKKTKQKITANIELSCSIDGQDELGNENDSEYSWDAGIQPIVYKVTEFAEIPKLVVDIHHTDRIDEKLIENIDKMGTVEWIDIANNEQNSFLPSELTDAQKNELEAESSIDIFKFDESASNKNNKKISKSAEIADLNDVEIDINGLVDSANKTSTSTKKVIKETSFRKNKHSKKQIQSKEEVLEDNTTAEIATELAPTDDKPIEKNNALKGQTNSVEGMVTIEVETNEPLEDMYNTNYPLARYNRRPRKTINYNEENLENTSESISSKNIVEKKNKQKLIIQENLSVDENPIKDDVAEDLNKDNVVKKKLNGKTFEEDTNADSAKIEFEASTSPDAPAQKEKVKPKKTKKKPNINITKPVVESSLPQTEPNAIKDTFDFEESAASNEKASDSFTDGAAILKIDAVPIQNVDEKDSVDNENQANKKSKSIKRIESALESISKFDQFYLEKKAKKPKKNNMDIDIANILDLDSDSINRRSPRKRRTINEKTADESSENCVPSQELELEITNDNEVAKTSEPESELHTKNNFVLHPEKHSSDTNESLSLLERMNNFENKNLTQNETVDVNTSKDSLPIISVSSADELLKTADSCYPVIDDQLIPNELDNGLPISTANCMEDVVMETKSLSVPARNKKRKIKKKKIISKATDEIPTEEIKTNNSVSNNDQPEREYQLAKINIKDLLLSSLAPPNSTYGEQEEIPSEMNHITTNLENKSNDNNILEHVVKRVKVKAKKQKGKKSKHFNEIFDDAVEETTLGKQKNNILSKNLSFTALKDALSTFTKTNKKNAFKKTDSMFSEIQPLSEIISSSEMDIAPVLDEIDKSLECDDIYDFNEDIQDEIKKSKSTKNKLKIRSNSCPKVSIDKESAKRTFNRSAKIKAIENIHEKALNEPQDFELNIQPTKAGKRSKSLSSSKDNDDDKTTPEDYEKTDIDKETSMAFEQEVANILNTPTEQYESNLLNDLEVINRSISSFSKDTGSTTVNNQDLNQNIDPDQNQIDSEGLELRRSRRGSRKVPSYNENDLIDPLVDALEDTRNRAARKDKSVEKNQIKVDTLVKEVANAKPKLSSEELFDLLKKSSFETNVSKPRASFFDNLNDPSSNGDIIDNAKLSDEPAQDPDKIYEFTEESPENTEEIKELFAKKKKSKLEEVKITSELPISIESNISLSLPESKLTEKDQEKSNYCDICKKSFIRLENLIKHKTTLTHISKLSELEAKEAEERARLEKRTSEEQSNSSLKAMDALRDEINITDILQQSERSQVSIPETSPLHTNHSLKLVDIISDVLNKPVLENYNPDKQEFVKEKNDVRRYKSLGERKSFESESHLSQINAPLPPTSYLAPTLSQTTILENQINLLENIIGNNLENIASNKHESQNNFIDDVSSCSIPSNVSDIDNNSCITNRSAFNMNSENIEVISDADFIKPTQYEEISEDSASARVYEDPKQRKTLNRDEELFLECCSLLKSGSEVSNSNYSKKTTQPVDGFKEVDEPELLERKQLLQTEEAHQYSDNSRTPTPLGDTYDDDASNSNTISSNWHLNSEKPLDKNRSFSFEEVKSKEAAGMSFGEILTKGLRHQFENATKENERGFQDISSLSVDERKEDSDSSTASKKIATKGARKVYEGLKVSIPTEDLNLDVLNKKSDIKTTPTSEENVEQTRTKTRKSKPVKKSQVGSNLLFKITKKKSSTPAANSVQAEKQDIYNFEETQDNIDVFVKPSEVKLKEVIIASDNESLGYADSIGADAKSVSSVSSISAMSAKKPEVTPENITKKKYKIMGKIFRNAAKSKMDDIDEELRSIPEIPEIDNLELVENYVRSCQRVKSPFLPPPPPPPLDEVPKKPKMTEEEMNMLFDQLLGKEVNEPKPEKSTINKPAVTKVKADTKNNATKKKNGNVRNRKRARANSESSDDEFNINRTAKKRTNKKNNQEDSGINLELELKECIGVASRKSQRTCTSGKQNILVEYWSSDEEAFEAMLESHKIYTKKDDEKKKVEKKKAELPKEVFEKPLDKPAKPKPPKKKSQVTKKPKPTNTKDPQVNAAAIAASNRRKRAAANPLYHWSSSSEDESQSLIEVKPVREEDDEDDRPIQHGWIVGDSPKKLVTMLALTKGKKTDIDSVKEQGKRRTSNTVS